MLYRILDFERLSRTERIDDDYWEQRYQSFGKQVDDQIRASGKSVHYILSNIASLRGALGKGYRVRKLNNAFKKVASLDELKDRVRLQHLQVVVIDAVSGFIEVSKETDIGSSDFSTHDSEESS